MSYEFYIIKRQKTTPRDIPDILEWAHSEIDSTDPKSYDDSNVLCRALRGCYFDMLTEFPALNGRDSPDDDGYAWVDSAVDYCLTRNVIEISCGWGQFDTIYPFVIRLAKKYGLMIYHIDTFFFDDAPRRVVARYCVDEFPTVWKAFKQDFFNPVLIAFFIVVGSIMGLYYLFIYLFIDGFPYNIKAVNIWIVFGTAVVVALGYCSALAILGIRNRRKGVRLIREIDRLNEPTETAHL